MTTPAQRGYLIKNLSVQSTKEIIKRSSHDRILTITKGAVKDFISQIFSTDQGKAVLEAVSPDAVRYVINRSFNPNDDHTKIELQLSAIFEELKESLPAILLIDYGVVFQPSGISPLARTTYTDNKFETVFHIIREMPMSIVVAANDEETCGQLMVLLQFMFGDLRNFLDGDQLNGNTTQDEWTVTLPRVVGSDNLQPVAPTELQNDPKDRIWRASITFPQPIIFEDYIKVEEVRPTIEVHDQFKNETPEIVFGDSMRINVPKTIGIRHFNPTKQKVTVSDARIASLDPNNGIITARGYGTFDIRVMDKVQNNIEGGVSNGLPPKILTSKTVTVTV